MIKIPSENQAILAKSNTVIDVNSENSPDSLHLEFIRLGKERHKITYKLLALLPKIYKSGVYREKGFISIFEYSFKLAGLSESLVKKALKLNEHLENKPCLQKVIETQGIHKVALVAKLATPQTDSFFADKVENMSKEALVELSKEMRGKERLENMELLESGARDQSEQYRREIAMKIELDKDMQFLFLKLKKEMGGKMLSNKEFLRRLLRKMAIKSQMMTKSSNNGSSEPKSKNFPEKISRYIPVTIKRSILEKTGEKCAHEGCNRPYEIFHHQERFSISKSHESTIPLCKIHHEFAHNGLRENDEDTEIDRLFQEYRREALR